MKSSGEHGFIGIGMVVAFMVVISALILLSEYIRAFSIRKSIVVELSRAINSSVEISLSDEYRKDRISRLNRDIAYESFYDFLCYDLGLVNMPDGTLAYGDPSGGGYCELAINELYIGEEPPQMSVEGDIIIRSGLLSGITSEEFRLPVSCGSINHRIAP